MIINSKHVSGGGADPVINPLTVTANGTYTAPSGVDGYSPVTVNVSGGGGFLKESGEIAVHTGANTYTLSIPVSDDTKANYLVLVQAKNAWADEDGVWIEREGLDFSGLSSVTLSLSFFASTIFTPTPPRISTTGGDAASSNKNSGTVYCNTGNTNTVGDCYQGSITPSEGYLQVYNSGIPFARTGVGLTHEYTVIGWD